MKLLVIDEEFPWPLHTGKRLRSFNLTKALTAHHEVSYLAYGNEHSEGIRSLERHGIACYPVEAPDRRQAGPRFYWRLFANLSSSLPYIVSSHYTARFERRLRDLLAQGGYDLLICEWTPYAIYLRRLTGVTSIIVAHNIESNIWQRYVETTPNRLKRMYIRLQHNKVTRFERQCFTWSAGATAVSGQEARTITALGAPYAVETVENGVDVQYFHPTPADIDAEMLVFTGSMDWRPNQDAVEYFVCEILPILRRQRPGIHFVAVGQKPPRPILELGKRPGVLVTGTVDDVRPYIARAALFVVPLRVGGGSRLKILEAMAMHKAVLSTSVGAEGLNVVDDGNIVLADGAEAFAAGVLRLLDDPVRRSRLAAAGYALVQGTYRWDRLGEKLHHYVERVARQQGASMGDPSCRPR